LALLLAVLNLAPAQADAQISDGVVKIGVLNDESGPYAAFAGPGSRVAALMAVEDFDAAAKGIKVERVMTDNGSCYKSFAFRRLCRRLGLRHITTKPYTPKTNGKAERFVQTSLREWAYAQAYQNSRQRKALLPSWLHRYNWHRPHAALHDKVPISRLRLAEDNLLRLHT
jgi:transposase InsO family protein